MIYINQAILQLMYKKFFNNINNLNIDATTKAIIENIISTIVIGKNIVNNICDIIKIHDKIEESLLIADANTIQLLDKQALNELKYYLVPEHFDFNEDLINAIRKQVKSHNLIVAFGSGSINDLCKYISFLENKPYILFPTAASMNGYVSQNTTIRIKNKCSNSVLATLPKSVYVDVDIIVNAPQRLTKSGFADFICRSTVQSDWLLSHYLLDTNYNETPFILIKELEYVLLENYLGLLSGSESVIMLLMQALLLSGIGMVIAGSSCSASQGEHILANCMDIFDNNNLLHGEKISYTTLTMAYLQQRILSTTPNLKLSFFTDQIVELYFNDYYSNEFLKIFHDKMLVAEKIEYLNEIIIKKWHLIANEISEKSLSVDLLKKVLSDLGLPTKSQHLNWNENVYRIVANVAFITRNRFTFLDLAHYMRLNCV